MSEGAEQPLNVVPLSAEVGLKHLRETVPGVQEASGHQLEQGFKYLSSAGGVAAIPLASGAVLAPSEDASAALTGEAGGRAERGEDREEFWKDF